MVVCVCVGVEGRDSSWGGVVTGHLSGNDCMTVPVGVEFKG